MNRIYFTFWKHVGQCNKLYRLNNNKIKNNMNGGMIGYMINDIHGWKRVLSWFIISGTYSQFPAGALVWHGRSSLCRDPAGATRQAQESWQLRTTPPLSELFTVLTPVVLKSDSTRLDSTAMWRRRDKDSVSPTNRPIMDDDLFQLRQLPWVFFSSFFFHPHATWAIMQTLFRSFKLLVTYSD